MPLINLPTPPLTAEDYERIPEPEQFRLELWEGNLVVAAKAQIAWHSAVARRIAALTRESIRGVGVVLSPRDVTIPDVVVFRAPITDTRRSQFPAKDVVRVVEVISPDSVFRDTHTKPAKCAAAGIPEFWLVKEHIDDTFDARVEIYKLTPEGGYGLAERCLLSELEER